MNTELEKQTQNFAYKFNALRDVVDSLNWEIEDIKRKHLPEIRKKLKAAKEQQTKLNDLIEKNKDSFVKPKTKTFHGIKIGYQKKKGTIKFSSNSIDLIHNKLTARAKDLIITKEYISKIVAAQLTVGELKLIGGEVIQDTDVIVIKSVDSNVDKLVNQLLADDNEVKL